MRLPIPRSRQGFINNLAGGVHIAAYVPPAAWEEITPGPDCLFFRGDSRTPGEIFPNGFMPRERAEFITYRIDKQDVDPQTCVGITKLFNFAAMCPLKFDRTLLREGERNTVSGSKHTFVYVIEPRKVFLTYEYQSLFANREIRDMSIAHVGMARKNLVALEAAVLEISSNEIAGCFEVKRNWYGRDFHDGGTYKVIQSYINPNYDNDWDEYYKYLFSHLSNVHRLNGTGKLPNVPREA